MSGWSEDDFLEAMMPVLRKKRGPDWCPDAETLSAVVEGNVSDTQSHAVAEHAAQCPACTNLIERLQSFDQADAPLRGKEWKQTEKRLDNWLARFLASEAIVRAVDGRDRKSGLQLWWQRLTEPIGALQIRWVLVPAAALALMIFSFLVGRVSVREVPQTIAKAVPPKEAVAEATTPPTASGDMPSQRKPTQPEHFQTAPQASAPRAEPNRIARGGPQNSRSTRKESVTETVVVTPASPISPERPVIASAPELPQPIEAAPLPAPTSTTARGDTTTQAAQIPDAATSPIPGRQLNRGVVRAAPPSGVRAVAASRSDAASIPNPQTQQAPSIPVPSEVRLEAGTRVWISLKSVHQRADGASEFSGVVLLPVMQSGAMLLDRNTPISGIVSVRPDKTTVQIMEFVLNRARYRLQGAGSEANTRAGAGTAVKFDAGKVLETWIVSTSIFGKLPEDARAPEK